MLAIATIRLSYSMVLGDDLSVVLARVELLCVKRSSEQDR